MTQQQLPAGKRPIDLIVVHCAATKPDMDIGAAEIRKWHTYPPPAGRGWNDIGYHHVIRLDGRVENGRPLDQPGAHAEGFNARSIGICLVGGIDKKGNPSNTFNRAQFIALATLLGSLQESYPHAKILGHRDLPAVHKACPSFDVRGWCAQHGIDPEPMA